mmetsp:Transcript_49264/g.130494  ORF Transcript_49264/g.130494 Transcript_49264/m.130494 type:complete len:260 (-) Transcript_49264:250-1029(-)
MLGSSKDQNVRYVYLVRHAESRYNVGVRNRNVWVMVKEKDHGLSPEGVEQCRQLSERITQAAADGDTHATAILGRSETLSSPLCRAVVTGHLALPRTGSRHLVTLLPDGREQCMMAVFARDSEGTPRSKIESRVLEELGELGVTSDTLDLSLEQMPTEKWWVVHEDDASMRARADRLLRDLYSESERKTTIFVGHSRSVRHLFRSFGGEFKASQLGAQFATTAIQNCAVLLVSLARGSEDETPSIVGAEFLFGTTFASH